MQFDYANTESLKDLTIDYTRRKQDSFMQDDNIKIRLTRRLASAYLITNILHPQSLLHVCQVNGQVLQYHYNKHPSSPVPTTSCICVSSPPMSLYCSVGLSSSSIAFTRESYSVGNFSRMRYESLLTPYMTTMQQCDRNELVNSSSSLHGKYIFRLSNYQERNIWRAF